MSVLPIGALAIVIALLVIAIQRATEARDAAVRVGLRMERLPTIVTLDDARVAPFDQAQRALLGRRWNTREADALAELVEMGRELP